MPTILGPAPSEINPVPKVYRNSLCRMMRSREQIRHRLNTLLTGGRTGVVAVGIFGKRFGRIRRYSNEQAWRNEQNRIIHQNFLQLSQGLELQFDRLIERAWAHFERLT